MIETVDSPKQPLREEFSDYLNSPSFRAFDRDRIEREEQNGLVSDGNEKMSKDCKIVITIPAFHTEKHLARTLLQYLKQLPEDPGEEAKFEIIILVNGPQKMGHEKLDLTRSIAYEEVLKFMERNPRLKVFLTYANYPEGSQKIGLIRKDLGALTVRRALESSEVELRDLVMVTNDADLQELSPEYITSIAAQFGNNAKLAAMTGFVDYPYEDFYADHLFLTVQRFVDMLETMRRFKMGKTTLRGGNTMIRLADYVASGGHNRARKSENLPIYRHILAHSGPDGVSFDRHNTKIVTSSRRQIAAIADGVPLVDRYKSFGKEGDLAEKYQAPREKLLISEKVHKVTSPDFINLLTHELQTIYERAVSDMSELADVDDGGALGRLSKTEEFMKRAAFYLGFQIEFHDGNLKVKNIDKLKGLILEKYDHN